MLTSERSSGGNRNKLFYLKRVRSSRIKTECTLFTCWTWANQNRGFLVVMVTMKTMSVLMCQSGFSQPTSELVSMLWLISVKWFRPSFIEWTLKLNHHVLMRGRGHSGKLNVTEYCTKRRFTLKETNKLTPATDSTSSVQLFCLIY